MKKLLPIIILILGVVVVGVVLLLKRGGGTEDENANLRELSLAEKPFTSLTPKEDGHWLKMSIDKISVADAKSLDYELLYKTKEGVTQGVPGTIPLTGDKIERDLLLGSESSGKFRYDEGVSEGTLNLRLRNDKGKLIAKLSTDFHLQKSGSEAATLDGKFKYTFEKESKDVFFVTMGTFGLPKENGGVVEGPYGVFASKSGPFVGSVNIGTQVQHWDGSVWKSIDKSKSPDVGVFIGVGE